MKQRIAIGAAVAMLLGTGALGAADMGDYGLCKVAGNAALMSIETDAALTTEVVRLMDESVAVADSDRWIDSSRPAFTWASEAKVACGKAYGYLRGSYRDQEYLEKCECFHARMVQYMN